MKCRYFKSTNKKCRGGGKTIMDTKEIKICFKNVFKADIKDNSVLWFSAKTVGWSAEQPHVISSESVS